jgi:hypothetical protein
MRRVILWTTLLAALAFPIAAFGLIDVHVNGKDVTCTVVGSGKNTAVRCYGRLTGLGGTETATAEVTVGYRCTTSSLSNDPAGTNKNRAVRPAREVATGLRHEAAIQDGVHE